MTVKKGILFSGFGLIAAAIYYFVACIEYHPIKEEWLCYNPFKLSKQGFEHCYSEGVTLRDAGDTVRANDRFQKALKYRGSHNERTFNRWFTDGNDAWTYALEKDLKYSACYEALGLLDSAMAVLRDGLINVEKYDVPVEENFFRLAIIKFGREEVLTEIQKGVKQVQPLDCFMCLDFFFLFKGYRVGIVPGADDTSDSLAQQVIRQYQL